MGRTRRCRETGCKCPNYFGNECSGFGASTTCSFCGHDLSSHETYYVKVLLPDDAERDNPMARKIAEVLHTRAGTFLSVAFVPDSCSTCKLAVEVAEHLDDWVGAPEETSEVGVSEENWNRLHEIAQFFDGLLGRER